MNGSLTAQQAKVLLSRIQKESDELLKFYESSENYHLIACGIDILKLRVDSIIKSEVSFDLSSLEERLALYEGGDS